VLNDHDLAAILMLTTCGLLVTTITFAVAWIRTRERAFRAELLARNAQQGLDSDSTGHMQRTIDAVALEVERVGEAQRFLTRLLAERDAAKAQLPERGRPAEPGRVITPH
jgi:hypothetical protein